MKTHWTRLLSTALLLIAITATYSATAQTAVSLPTGVKANWNLSQAYHETTPTRERVCINGLWLWQPDEQASSTPPKDRWGYFKTPGCWVGITDYMQKDCQTVFAHPSWKETNLSRITSAWYQREITVPAGWKGRRIALSVEYLNSYALVFVDGKRVGDLHFPAGELDITNVCRAGQKHTLSMRVVAMPLKAVMLSYQDTSHANEIKGEVARRGLCGDVFLTSTPAHAHITATKLDTSVTKWEVQVTADTEGLSPNKNYTLHASITEQGREVKAFTSPVFKGSTKAGRTVFRASWKPAKLWDLHTPQNQYQAALSLREEGTLQDVSHPTPFGFREFVIKGKDFYLNGSRLFLSAVPLDNAQIGAALSTYAGAKESLKRLQSFGINFVYTHNYDCEPGAHLSFTEILRAADDVGMLVALTQPHFSHYEWKNPGAERTNNYARHAAFYVKVAQNHPSVVAYSMSHNATGYNEDMNPDMIDGIHADRDEWSNRNAKMALRAEAIVKSFDPSRIVYHHAGGNIGAIHSSNFYPNFVPIQELSDWFGHWSKEGVKPVFLCEYGAPFTWDWTMYRGWYKGKREWGSAEAPWEYCLAEWNAQFLGDSAYKLTDMERANVTWEAKQFREGRLWHRWDYPYPVGSNVFKDEHTIIGRYLQDNWRAFRTWGVSGISPWEHDHFWKLRAGVDRGRKELKVDWDNLQRPGFSPDYRGEQYERFDLAYEAEDWVPTEEGRSLLRNNMPTLAYIGGKSAKFTSKDHNFYVGETVEKQLILINNSRKTVTFTCTWESPFPLFEGEKQKITVTTGEQRRIPIRFSIPRGTEGKAYTLKGTFLVDGKKVQKDQFVFHVFIKPFVFLPSIKVALFDPKRETESLLKFPYQRIQATDSLEGYEALIIGKGAVTLDNAIPDIRRVREGLKVLVFEQSSEVLEKRFGFRVEEYGLRQVFRRILNPDLGFWQESLHDWRGEATTLPPRLAYTTRAMYGPTVQWCGIDVTRVWRCGSQGSVASVLIEKPARGDFRPILDGGYNLQYSPLMEYHEGKGLIVFCQMDVTGRTEKDPAAETLTHNLMNYLADWKPSPQREAVYVGSEAGRAYLEASGVTLQPYKGGETLADQTLIVTQGGGKILAQNRQAIGKWLDRGGRLLVVGLEEKEANAFLPFSVHTTQTEYINTYFEPVGTRSLLAGISPAELYLRAPRVIPLLNGGANLRSYGVLATQDYNIFCQLVPWEFDNPKQMNLKRTYRRLNVLMSRLLANMGVAQQTPLLERFVTPLSKTSSEKRWLQGFYRDDPEEWDDPYRFFRW